jgi:hypothetical protein
MEGGDLEIRKRPRPDNGDDDDESDVKRIRLPGAHWLALLSQQLTAVSNIDLDTGSFTVQWRDQAECGLVSSPSMAHVARPGRSASSFERVRATPRCRPATSSGPSSLGPAGR